MKRPDIDGLIRSLHQGVRETPYWSGFLEQLRGMTNAGYASLVFQRSDAGQADISVIRAGDQINDSGSAGAREIASRLNLSYDSLRVNRPYSLEDIVGLDDDRGVEYVRYLRERNIGHAVVLRVGDRQLGNGWLTLGRAGDDFKPWVIAVLKQIAPHLGIAVGTLAELERARMRADIANDAVHRLNFGWVTFDRFGNVVEIDPDIQRLFSGIAILRSCACGLPFPIGLSGHEHKLLDILKDFAVNEHARPRAMHLVQAPWLDMLIVPISYRALSGGSTPVAVGYVHGVVGAADDDKREQLKLLFGLNHSEARLAIALAQGRSITEAAADLSLTVETARNYSKKIYAKTDARGHADLVRILLASVIALT